MRFKYTFKVYGRIRPAQLMTFEVELYRFEFVVQNGFIHEIQVSFPVTDSDLPAVTTNPEPGIALHINMTSPRLHEVEEIVRSIEGLWSFWGLESINVHRPKHEWIAEGEDEKERLQLLNFSYGKKEIDDNDIRPISFDLLARPIISAVKKKEHDVILSFYRRGCNDIKKEEYIEAIYDFYFVLESSFSNGKNRNYAVEKEFLNNIKLRGHIEDVCSDHEAIAMMRKEDRVRYQAIVNGKSVDDIIKFIVSTRGFLHHHTEKRKDIWNPEKQEQYKAEAFFFQNLCYKIAFDIFAERIFNGDVVGKYHEIVGRHS